MPSFQQWRGLTSLIMPSLQQWRGLTSLVMPSFQQWRGLTSLIMPSFQQWRGLTSLDGDNLLAFYSVHLTSVLTRPGERGTAVLHLLFLSHNAGGILRIRRIGKSHHTNTVINMPDITTKSTKGINNWALIRIIERYMKRNFKQWSIIQPISKQTITSHLKPFNAEKTMT